MKRKIGAFFLLFVFASLAFSGCFSPWKGDEATLTLLLGGSSGSRAAKDQPTDETLSYLVHSIELNGPTGRQSHTVQAQDPKQFNVKVMPGYWHITIRALLNTTLYAQSEIDTEIKTGQNNQVEIKLEPVIKGDLFFVTDDFDESSPNDLTRRILRNVLTKAVSSSSAATIIIMLPPGSEIKLENNLSISTYDDLTIEGNGITLSKKNGLVNATNLMTIYNTGKKVTIRRVHFKGSDGEAIHNENILSLESCIFSYNKTTAFHSDAGAIYNNGTMYVKGCTFYRNIAKNQGGAIYNSGGQINELRGNLFSENAAGSPNNSNGWPVIANIFGSTTSAGYNVVDVELGDTNDTQSGWKKETGDQSFPGAQLIYENFKPVPALNSIVPKNLQDFPTTDFYGNNRTSGAPGAVN